MKMDIEKKKCITPRFRVSFPAIDKPKAFEGQEAKYSLVMCFDKDEDISVLKRAWKNAGIEKWGADQTKWPKFKHKTFRDGDKKEPTMEGYENVIYCTASAKETNPPGVVDKQSRPMLNIARDFYAGCYARAEVIAFAYDRAGNKGISFSLQNLQKLDDGERLSGKRNAEDVFDKVEDDSDDEESYDLDDDTDAEADEDEEAKPAPKSKSSKLSDGKRKEKARTSSF